MTTPTPDMNPASWAFYNKEAGYVEFINSDAPYIVRDISAPAAILLDMETRQVIGYRVYEPPTDAEHHAEYLEAMADVIMMDEIGMAGKLEAKLVMEKAAKFIRTTAPSREITP